MQLVLILMVIAGMGLSVEAGYWAAGRRSRAIYGQLFSVFGVGAALTFLLMLFFSPRTFVIFRPTVVAAPGRRARPGLRHHSDRRHTRDWRGDDHDWRAGRSGV